MSIEELRTKRITAEIPATLLAIKAKINRSRLSGIERGYVQPSDEELHRLAAALNELVKTKVVMQRTAVALGWPSRGIR